MSTYYSLWVINLLYHNKSYDHKSLLAYTYPYDFYINQMVWRSPYWDAYVLISCLLGELW